MGLLQIVQSSQTVVAVKEVALTEHGKKRRAPVIGGRPKPKRPRPSLAENEKGTRGASYRGPGDDESHYSILLQSFCSFIPVFCSVRVLPYYNSE